MLTSTAVVVCALNLLGRSLPSPVPILFLDSPPPGVSRSAEAFVLRDPDTIYLITSSEPFRQAQSGRFEPRHRAGCKKLASIIVHEEWHLRHGNDEEGAYLAQLTTLDWLGAEPIVLTQVRQAMARVREAQRRQKLAEGARGQATAPAANGPPARSGGHE